MTVPSVSVLLPVYNGGGTLAKALRSIQAQTWRDLEIVAVDDGSTDGSGEFLEQAARLEPRLRVIRQDNQGLGPALARAAFEARGDLLARQDADDVSAPTRIAKQADYMRARPEVALCGTSVWLVHPSVGPLFSYVHSDDDALLRSTLEAGHNPIFHGTAMFRASLYRATHGYRLRKYCEDFDLWLQLAELGKLGNIESVEYLYSISANGMSNRLREVLPKLRDLSLALHRERRLGGGEKTAWKEREDAILATAPGSLSNVEVESYQAYYLGLHALRQGDFSRYRRQIVCAAGGEGEYSRKARWHRLIFWAAPIVRGAYRIISWTSRDRFMRSLPLGTPQPDFGHEASPSRAVPQ